MIGNANNNQINPFIIISPALPNPSFRFIVVINFFLVHDVLQLLDSDNHYFFIVYMRIPSSDFLTYKSSTFHFLFVATSPPGLLS